MKKLLYLIILVSHFSFGESFKSQLDTNAILIGQQIKFSLKASNINSEIVWQLQFLKLPDTFLL